MSTPRCMQAGLPQGSGLSPTLYNLYINDTPPNYRCKYSSFCGWRLSICDRTQGGLCFEKRPTWLNSMLAWCERWNIKINEDKTQTIYFSHRRRPPDFLLTLNGQNIPFVNSVKYLGVSLDKGMTCGLHKVLRTIDNFLRHKQVRDLNKAFNIPSFTII
jgi:hypothetical protein